MSREIFISYRRDDSAGHAGRVHDRLTAEFGRDLVFMDVESIPLGFDFVETLGRQIAKCAILLALIGSDWIDARDSNGRRRLEDPADFVRLEIRSALERRIPVIPIAVGGYSFPLSEQALPEDIRALRYRQGIEVRNGSFSSDMTMLVGKLRGLMERPARLPLARSAPSAPRHAERARNGTKVEMFSLMIFWHASGLCEQDARRMQSSLASAMLRPTSHNTTTRMRRTHASFATERTCGLCATCWKRFPILHSTFSLTTTQAKSAACLQNTR